MTSVGDLLQNTSAIKILLNMIVGNYSTIDITGKKYITFFNFN